MNNNKYLPYIVAVLLSFIIGSSVAIAQLVPPVIHEIQLGPDSDDPTYIVIYGTGFELNPDFGIVPGTPAGINVFLGTESEPLVLPDDQTACDALAPPPLDTNNTDCVVADFTITVNDVETPLVVPDGDYRVRFETNTGVPACSCDNGRPIELTFQYTQNDCSASTYPNGTQKHSCTDLATLTDPVDVVLTGKDADKFLLSQNSLGTDVGSSVTVTSSIVGDRLSPNLVLDIFNISGDPLEQNLEIHTSCSAPLATGDDFGSMMLTEFIPVGGIETCPTSAAHYDLTIGAQGLQGDQGVQGKIGLTGDTGLQGVQGKIGLAGDTG
ncbi:MAG: hypothetical protein KAT04_03470, partial [Methylococcales bacterium]|nr:hypothetical protein [Methylococcales bacterium]